MKKYIFITAAIFIFILFESCSSSSSTTSRKCESNCFNVHVSECFGNKRYDIVTYEDRVKMKRYTILVCTAHYGCGCTLIDTEEIK